MELQEAIRHRRSVRLFQERPVEAEKIKQLIDAAQWAPSACNKQGWRFIAVTETAIKERFVKSAGASYLIKKAPVVIFVFYEKHLTVRKDAQIQSAAAAIQNLLLMAHALGLGATWLASLGKGEAAKIELGVPEAYQLIAAVILGYPKEIPMAPQRRSVDDILSFEYYNFSDGPYPYTYNVRRWPMAQLIRFRENSLCASSPTENTFSFGRSEETKQEVTWISEKLHSTERILEIMPFAGTHTTALFKKKDFTDYHLFELSNQPLVFTKKRLAHNGFVRELLTATGEPNRLPYPDGYFSAVVIFQKLEMLPDWSVISEIIRVLKPEGRLYLSFKNMFSLYGVYYWLKFRFFKQGQIWNYGPFQPINYFRIKKYLNNNFIIERESGISPAIFIGKNVGRSWSWLGRLVIMELKVKKVKSV